MSDQQVIASTTDTQADMERALGIPEKPEVEEQEPPEVPAVTEEAQPEEKPSKPKNAYQRRINQLVAQRTEADERARRLEERLAALERGEKPAPPQPQVAPEPKLELPPKPTINDVKEDGSPVYSTHEEFVEALAGWKLDERLAREAAREEQETQQEYLRQTYGRWNEKLDAFKEEHPDFDKITADRVVPEAAINLIIERGLPEVGYYLGQHPELCEELNSHKNHPLWVASKIGELAAKLNVEIPVEESEEEEPSRDRHEPRVARRAISNAPAPIKPVGGSATKSSVPMDEMSYADYKRMRERQLKDRYRR